MCNFMDITDVYAREILASDGTAAIEAEVLTEDGSVGKAAVPSESYTELCACQQINSVLADLLIGENVYAQLNIDFIIQKEFLGSGQTSGLSKAALSVSLAAADAAAASLQLPLFRYLGGSSPRRLPTPVLSLLSSKEEENILLLPEGKGDCLGSLIVGQNVYRELKEKLTGEGVLQIDGMNGSLIADLSAGERLMDMIHETIGTSQDGEERKFRLCAVHVLDNPVDEHAGDRRKSGEKTDEKDGEKTGKIEKLQMVSITDSDGYRADVTVIEPKRFDTLSEILLTIEEMHRGGAAVMLAHRGTDTEDTKIVDIAVAMGAEMLSAGAPCGGERTAKYNRLIKIEDYLGIHAMYQASFPQRLKK